VEGESLITLTADIVAAHVANNSVGVGDIGNLVQQVHEALAGLGQHEEKAPEAKTPLVSVRASVKPDYIVCMECGRRQKMLKRHLQNAHGMSPEQYRADYGLPREYPMVAPNYSQLRGELARASGLGRRRTETGDQPTRASGRGGGPTPKKTSA
jgi:predicted transcriptional regulator